MKNAAYATPPGPVFKCKSNLTEQFKQNRKLTQFKRNRRISCSTLSFRSFAERPIALDEQPDCRT